MSELSNATEISRAAQAMHVAWWNNGPICVKRAGHAFGIVVWQRDASHPVAIFRLDGHRDPLAALDDAHATVERFVTWTAAAEAGWRLD